MTENYAVLPEAEEFFYPGNEIGVLISHGFTGSTQSMRYLGQRIAEQGYTVYGPRLTGHGTDPEDMEQSSFQNWIADVEAGLEKLKETCQTIFVAGLSMGGTLTLYLGENHPELAGIMPINAAIDMPELKQNYESFRNTDKRFLEGIGSDIKKEGVKELAYPLTPIKSMGDLLSLMELVRRDLRKVTVPTLIFVSDIDHVVPPENSKEVYETISSPDKAIVQLKNSYHVATLDNDKELIAEECIKFIKAHI
ncbi:alpha/beta hydrolase [Bacillus litorisediminis]|uniref:alpha/beta hydrolase n=1 Tax=Bacillus litorisediminis TaxID=2922713 RepID=UPI001FADCCEA|nr:alpha/beta fold hydrolase [Bacillus litorisediminis]